MNQARLVTVPKRASPPTPTAPWHYSPGQQTDGPAAVLVAFANGWDSSGTQQGATGPCSCLLGSAEHGISPCSTRLLGSYFQRYYFKSVERGASRRGTRFPLSLLKVIRCR